MLAAFQGKLRTIAFSLDAKTARAHVKAGGEAVVHRGGNIVHEHSGASEAIIAISEIPATMDGVIAVNTQNAMAAIALALGMNIEIAHIRSALRGFENSVEKTHGRFNFLDGFPLKVLFDYARGSVALAASIDVANSVKVSGKRFCTVTATGNRPDWFYAEIAQTLAGHFDHYIFYDAKEWLRGRKPGEMGTIFAGALVAAGVPASAIGQAEDFLGACRLVAAEAKPADFAVMFGSNMDTSVNELRRAFSEKTNA
jgi:cyanophycin synthetase